MFISMSVPASVAVALPVLMPVPVCGCVSVPLFGHACMACHLCTCNGAVLHRAKPQQGLALAGHNLRPIIVTIGCPVSLPGPSEPT